MIVELFGPPGVGKTTFAHALEKRLRERGYVVETAFSNRPAEGGGLSGVRDSQRSVSGFFRRLMRPILDIFAVVQAPNVGNQAWTNLNAVNPPANVIWNLRLSLYRIRLSWFWTRASNSDHIFLFDQGYIQLICSLILLDFRKVDEAVCEKLLDAVPGSDLLVSLEAPRDILEQRLQERFRSQHPLERFLELDLETNLVSVEVIGKLHAILRQRGREVVRISSLDRVSLSEGLAIVEQKVDEIARNQRKSERQLPCG
jgi:thymidylate kinase